MMNWVETVSSSIPDHSTDVKTTLVKVMKTQNLTEIDAHACALAAALISGNGELGFAIEMFGPLQRARSEVNIAKSAATTANMHSIVDEFIQQSCSKEFTNQIENTVAYPGLETKFAMYSLAAGVIINTSHAKKHVAALFGQGVSIEAIEDIVTIAAVVNTIGKIAPEVDHLISSKL